MASDSSSSPGSTFAKLKRSLFAWVIRLRNERTDRHFNFETIMKTVPPTSLAGR